MKFYLALVLFAWLTLSGCNSEPSTNSETSQRSANTETYQSSANQMTTDPMASREPGPEKAPLKATSSDKAQKTSRESRSSQTVSIDNWRELYGLSYTLQCIDDRLGVSTTRQFQTGERGPTEDERQVLKGCDVEKSKSSNNDSDSGTARSVADWRELYGLSYAINCIDDRLGASITRKFQDGERGPTDAERQKLQGCDVQSDSSRPRSAESDDLTIEARVAILKDSGGWIRTGNPKDDQFVLGYVPTADEWKCGVEAVGVSVLRDIKAGNHSITEDEEGKLSPCFRASPDSLTHPLASVWEGHCIPLDVFLEFVDYYRPSWEQLECHLKDLERYEMPNQMRYVMLSDPYGIRNSKSILFPPLWDRVMTDPYYKDLELNFSPSMGNMSMPPSYDEEYNSIKCHSALMDENGKLILDENGKIIVDEYWIDEALRGAAIAWIIEKTKGRRIYADTDMCGDSYLVQGNKDHYKLPPINSIQDFKDRTLNLVIPQYVIRAKAAEAVKAEMMQINGVSGEIEVVFSRELFLGNLPPSEQVELAQWYLDTLIPEVRKHFHGTIWVASYANYDDGDPDFPGAAKSLGSGSYWKNLSFAAADYVSFTMYATCDLRHTQRYFNVQYDAIMHIVQRDNIRWGGAAAVEKRYFGPDFHKSCRDEFDDKLVEIEKLLISKVESLPIQPYTLNIPQAPRSWTKIDEGYSPTQADASKGDWQLFSLDVMETSAEIRELWMEYAKKYVLN